MSVAIRAITQIQEADDAPVLGAGQDGYALTWDNASGAFVATALFTGGLLATGATTGATSQAQAFTNGIIGPSWRPSADSTTALQLQNAAGTSVLNVDTTNGIVAIKTTSTGAERLSINTAHDGYTGIVVKSNSTSQSGYFASFKNSANSAIVWITGHGTSQANGLITALNTLPADPSAVAISSGANFGMNGAATNFYGMGLGALRNSKYDVWFQTGATNGGGYRFYIAGVTEAVTIDYTGRLGIGTTAPATLLHTLLASAATNAVTNVLTIGHNTSGTAANGFGAGLLFQLESSTTAAQDAGRIAALWTDATHATRASALTFSTLTAGGSLTERMRIDGAGNVGIGTTTPDANLVLYGDTLNNPYIRLKTNAVLGPAYANGIIFERVGATNNIGIFTDPPVGTPAESDALTFALVNNPWTRLVTVQQSGRVGINDTNPAEALDVTGNANVTGVYKVDDVQVLSNRVIDARCADVANSGDATTDGLIDALRDAMIAHGLIAAA